MFSRQSGLGNSSNSGHLIEFRAGRMNMIDKMVHADPRKGLVYLTQGEDGLMHFCWKDRTSGKVEDDLIVFPDDFEFKKVEQCKTGRVYVLKFKTSSRRMFFWMQEPKSDKDDEHCRRVNELMNNPPTARSVGGNEGGDLQYMLNNMSQQQLMQLFGGVGQMSGLSSLLGSMNRSDNPRTPSSNRNTSSTTTPALQTSDSNAAPRTPSAPTKAKPISKTGASATAATDGAGVSSDIVNVDLSTAITTSEAIAKVVGNDEKVERLAVHLPDLPDTDDDKKKQIMDTIASAQFQQALTLFSDALQAAQLGPVVSQFELTPEAVAAAYSGNVEDFVKALQKALPEGAKMETPTITAEPMETEEEKPKATPAAATEEEKKE